MLDLFFGCLFIAFGPAAVFLLEVVLNHSHLTVLAIVAAFYELAGFLLTSILWFILPDTFGGRTATALVLGACIQEAFRILFVFSYERGEKGLASVSGMTTLPFTDFPSALSSGFGFGLMYALLVYGHVLGKSTTEADLILPSCPNTSLFLVEAFCTLAMEILHVVLMILAFDAWRRRPTHRSRLPRFFVVFSLHILASLATLLNQDASLGGCSAGVPLLYLVTICAGLYAVKVVRESDFRIKGDFGAAPPGRNSVHQSTGGVGQ